MTSSKSEMLRDIGRGNVRRALRVDATWLRQSRLVQGIRWNVSPRASQLAEADCIVVSIPKSGRTWLRMFLAAYLSGDPDRVSDLDLDNVGSGKGLSVEFTHEAWDQVATPSLYDAFRGHHLIPQRRRRSKPILLLARDPRDVSVSLFFHLSKRQPRHRGDIASLLRHPVYGIEFVVRTMNAWIDEWHGHSNFHLLRYEDCRDSMRENFESVLRFIGIAPIDQELLSKALSVSRFEVMQRLEATGVIASPTLQPRDRSDPDTYKVRRGKVGAYREYVRGPDLAYANAVLEGLDERFGYFV